VERVDATTGQVVARIGVGGNAEALVGGFGLIWVTNQDGTLSTIDPAMNAVVGTKIVGDSDLDAVSAGGGAIWSTSFYGKSLLKIDPSSRRVLQRIQLGGEGGGVLFLDGSVWASVYDRGVVFRIDPSTGRVVRRVRVGVQPRDIVYDGRQLWTVNQGSDTISRFTQ
jgi:streptogramin lyase